VNDEELGRAEYEREAKNWPSPIGWDNLSDAAKKNWTERAMGDSYTRPAYEGRRRKPERKEDSDV
jgi:hypothetical protein